MFWVFICSECLYYFLYSVSWFAVCMSLAVERSSDSYPEALIILIFAWFGCGFICIGVYLSMYCGGGVFVFYGSRLSSSANVFSSAGMCFTLMLYGVMLSCSFNSLLFITSVRSLFFMFSRDLWSVKHSICFCAPFI